MLFMMLGEYAGELTDDLLAAHITWLVPQFENGTFIASGGLDEVPGRPAAAFAILEAESREQALEILSSEPFYRAGAIKHDVVPLHARVLGTDIDARLKTDDLLRLVPRA